MTKQEWTQACAQSFKTLANFDDEAALAVAEAVADSEESFNGLDPANWESPEGAAREELSNWSNDE